MIAQSSQRLQGKSKTQTPLKTCSPWEHEGAPRAIPDQGSPGTGPSRSLRPLGYGGMLRAGQGVTVPSLAGAVPGGPSGSGQGVSSEPLVAQTLLCPREPRLGFSLSPLSTLLPISCCDWNLGTLSQSCPTVGPIKTLRNFGVSIKFEFLRTFLSTLLGTECDASRTKSLRGSLKSLCCVCAAEAPGTETAPKINQEKLQKDISEEKQLLSQPSRAEGTACRH